jgi:hypothetical protein
MFCKKCSGRVFVDRVFNSHEHIEMYCTMCGKRWIFHEHSAKNFFARWAINTEKKYLKNVQG